MSSEIELIEQRLRDHLQLLSSPASTQIAYLSAEGPASIDDLAEDFEQWERSYLAQTGNAAAVVLMQIDQLFEENSGRENASKWTEEALKADPFWEEIRSLSNRALALMPDPIPNNVILKRFEQPDETRHFPKGKFEIIHVGGMTIGCATYQPGWKWSEDVGRAVGEKFCTVEHVGMVVSGYATAAMKREDGSLDVVEMKPGDLFYVPGHPHDSWVVGDEPYVSLHFLGAGKYASKQPD